MKGSEVAYGKGWAAGEAQLGFDINPYVGTAFYLAWCEGYNDGAASLIEPPKIGYVALKSIKYQLHETFDKIKTDPMNLNLVMEHIAMLTSSVATLSEYLAGNESDHDPVLIKCPQCHFPLDYSECSHCGFDATKMTG